jgi:photosystem II stability/assembly factor-like uncharacterized protein
MPHISARRRGAGFAVLVFCSALAVTAITGAASATESTAAPRAASSVLEEIAFFSLDHGYGVFTTYGTKTCSDRIGVSDDAGARFTSLAFVDRWPCGQIGPASSLAFDDHGDGFFYGPKLFETHNGGASWSPDPQHGAVLSVEALGYSIWMLETARQPPSRSAKPHSMGLRLLESDNGGYTWADVPLPTAAYIAALEASDMYWTGWLTRTSLTSAYVASAAPLRGERSAQPMWFTDDDGATWSNAAIPCVGIGGSVIMSVAPQGTAFAVCANEPGAGTQVKQVLESTDNGAHWAYRLGCARLTECGPNSDIEGYVSGIDAVTATTIYQVGGRSNLVVSHDAGRAWRSVPAVDTASGDGTSQVIFFSPADGMVLGAGYPDRPQIWETTDGGVHWTSRFATAS